MMFTLRLSWRYAFSQSNRHRNASVTIMVGIAVGMLAMITMLSLMNSLQSDLLDQVKSIESFHMQVSFPPDGGDSPSVADIVSALGSIGHVESVHPCINTQVLVQNRRANRSATARLRIVDDGLWTTDNPFSQRTTVVSGGAPRQMYVSLGYPLAAQLALGEGDEFSITMLGEGKAVVLAPLTLTVKAAGTFRTGLHEFDTSTVIADFEPFLPLTGDKRVLYGLYLDPGHADEASQIVDEVKRLFPRATVKTWQEVNNAFYSALMLEKVLMYLFLFFMFIILGVNMKNSSSRLLYAKQRELAILRALGIRKKTATKVFITQSVLITAIGELLGIAGGLLLSGHIGSVFSWINRVQQMFTGRNNVLLSYPFITQVRPSEVAVVAVSVLALASLFTFLGCRKLLGREPMEMLRHV